MDKMVKASWILLLLRLVIWKAVRCSSLAGNSSRLEMIGLVELMVEILRLGSEWSISSKHRRCKRAMLTDSLLAVIFKIRRVSGAFSLGVAVVDVARLG